MTDGGPAFPSPLRPEDGFWNAQGMSLRDWFAGQALVGIGIFGLLAMDCDERARICYAHADAMLAVRARKSTEESNA